MGLGFLAEARFLAFGFLVGEDFLGEVAFLAAGEYFFLPPFLEARGFLSHLESSLSSDSVSLSCFFLRGFLDAAGGFFLVGFLDALGFLSSSFDAAGGFFLVVFLDALGFLSSSSVDSSSAGGFVAVLVVVPLAAHFLFGRPPGTPLCIDLRFLVAILLVFKWLKMSERNG